MSAVAQGARQRARVICDPSRLREQETRGPGGATTWDYGLLIVAGGDGAINGLGRSGSPDDVTLAPTMLSGYDYLEKEGAFFARAKEIRVETKPSGLEFTVDGEVIGDEPAEFTVVPRAVNVIAGPGYRMGYGESA